MCGCCFPHFAFCTIVFDETGNGSRFSVYQLNTFKKMTTQINGVEITPQMAKVLTRWYNADHRSENTCLISTNKYYTIKTLAINLLIGKAKS
jgi:hypothetical protein